MGTVTGQRSLSVFFSARSYTISVTQKRRGGCARTGGREAGSASELKHGNFGFGSQDRRIDGVSGLGLGGFRV